MKPGPQGVRSLAKLGSPHQDMNPGPQGVQSLTNLGSPCQDMKPGPQGKLMYYYFYHGSDLREIIRFLRKIECIEFD